MNVDSFDITDTKPSITSRISNRLCVGGMVENVSYMINAIDYEIYGDDESVSTAPPEVGECIQLHYHFKGYHGGMYGYEMVCLFIGRSDEKGNIHNYVRYFPNIPALEKAISGLTLSLDKQFAITRIAKLQREINILTKKYEL